jgi:hypothetical protein
MQASANLLQQPSHEFEGLNIFSGFLKSCAGFSFGRVKTKDNTL